ncbi:FG-GAP-like repeat-containing protein [Reichenbachiella carrageenanivorans]|uniref:FG-GAP-like repeat-containing protein n=1 Tax=Reichenbachiella carrageenanivorans TaxID=2979869 RepID=A0ABY6D535_9BACT|nr:FG-GAP-like repeat-containing protein [Reichenbachiella carrageenanivorans]UXX81282.1 FG-GAP-like repeat-containing protein [Reichenbachiella carrageenanivorans]
MNMKVYLKFLLVVCLIGACTPKEDHIPPQFELLKPELTGLSFTNTIVESDSLNYFTYPYLYMGGGVAIADFDNDGLQDLFFTGNMVENKLYQNQGDLKFKDISKSSGTSGLLTKWYTGVSVADINADGYLDIYLSVSGQGMPRSNELYINNGDLTFTESAEAYGLADAGNSVQSSFFDYDHDGDLDLFVANYPITSFTTSNIDYRHYMNHVSSEKSDHLYRNDGSGNFSDVTEESGLLAFGLSLSAAVVDFNQDGWEDIYVSNDFSTPDYFYINNGDGTFSDRLKDITRQTCFYGMGTDAADYNNDGLIDLFQVDMSAADNRRIKANMASMNPALFWSTVNNGFHYQYMYNSLQANRGIVDDLPIMSNVAWMSGVSSTDWSWAPLFADFDNDGWKDLFVANGTRKEINNRDYFKKIDKRLKKANNAELLKLSDSIPSEPIDNFIFKNIKGQGFEKQNESWGMKYLGFSTGAAYGDLDNDGDLDLVISNIDSESVIFKNNASALGKSNYLRVALQSAFGNTRSIGAEVHIYTNGEHQVSQLQPTRGFQSSTEPILHFGLGSSMSVDSLLVIRADQIINKMYRIEANQSLEIDVSNQGAVTYRATQKSNTLLVDRSDLIKDSARHEENHFNDFDHQVLLPHKMSNFGPALAVGDINGDGLDDFYAGAASGTNGRFYLQQLGGGFESLDFQSEADQIYEDLDAMLFDVDNDQDLDLYIVSGGNEFEKGSASYQDRLFINDQGSFRKANKALPTIEASGSCVRPFDYDQDGDLDLFVGGRLDPRNYPYAGETYLLENKSELGELKFENATSQVAPELSTIGMVTDGLWTDFNKDGLIDLLVVGEWMPITVFINSEGQFSNQTTEYFDQNMLGWWFSVEQGDLDQDGDMDYIFGNLGTNYKYQAKPDETFDLYVSDFDGNQKHDIVLSYHNFGEQYPVRGRQCSSDQIPAIKVAYKDYNSFSTASMDDIFGSENLSNSLHFQVEAFSSIKLINLGEGRYDAQALPFEAQMSPINDWVIQDLNGDGREDVLAVGNLYASEVETPRNDSGLGLVLESTDRGDLRAVSVGRSGLVIPHDSKKVVPIRLKNKQGIIVANNKGPFMIFSSN